MKYFGPLKNRFSAFPTIKVEGLSDQEIQRLLFLHSVRDCPASVKEFLRFCGKRLGTWKAGAFGEYDDFIQFKLDMIYELVELNMDFPQRSDFVFFNNQDYAFAYIDLTSSDDDPFVSLLVTPEEEQDRLKVKYCKFSEFVINNTRESPPEYLRL